ncbi:MAG: hypothetical protein ACJ716_15995 [Marmoricola sp.]
MRWSLESPLAGLRRPRDERGVMAIAIALITCFTIVPLAAYAVDIGVQRVARRDIQAVADVVALDLARQLDGRSYSVIHGNLQALANKSAARNSAGSTAPTVIAQLGTLNDTSWSDSNPDAYFTPITSDAGGVPNAVKVTASTSAAFNINGGSGGVQRTAIARSEGNACFDVGSFALNLNSAKSTLLDSLINDSLNLSAISYTGLANANVSLLGLATELGAGTPSQLLALNDLSLNQLFLASAHALQAQGGDAADIALLNQLAIANLSSLPHIKFSDLLEIGSASPAAMESTVNLLDLVSTAAFVANGSNALAIPTLTAGVPNVTGVSASLKVIQKPEGACGPVGTQVRTAQVDLDVTFTIASLNVATVLVADSRLTLHLSLAQALATLTSIQCGTPEGFDTSVASALSQASSALHVDLKLVGLTLATVDVAAGTNAPAATNTVQFRHPPDSYDVAKSTGSGVALSTLTVTSNDVTVLGVLPITLTKAGIASSLLSTIVNPIVNPLIANANSILVGPLADLLGLNLGGADIIPTRPLNHPEKPIVCNDVKMAG